MKNKVQNDRNDDWKDQKNKGKGNFMKYVVSALVLSAMSIGYLEDAETIAAAGAGTQQSHLFAGGGIISDEGFRWRNSFAFTITTPAIPGFGPLVNAVIPVANWQFDNGGPGGFVAFAGGVPANRIHVALSAVVNGALGAVAGATGNHMAAAAVTIVIRNPNNGNLEAYTQVVRDNGPGAVLNSPAVAIPVGFINPANSLALTGAGLSMYYGIGKLPPGIPAAGNLGTLHLNPFVNNFLRANITPAPGAGNGYSCGEGQIIARLFDINPSAGTGPLFPTVINNLIVAANAGAPIIAINGNHIILVVLHLHTHQDPCAKCSKVLSALSKQMNMPPFNHLTQTPSMTALIGGQNVTQRNTHIGGQVAFAAANIQQLITNLGIGQARFLVEVSSDVPYNGIGGGVGCSHAEIAGIDANTAGGGVININTVGALNFAGPVGIPNGPHQLDIPNAAAGNNWIFPQTFPPYTVYGRVTPAGGIAAPNPCLPIANHVGVGTVLGTVN